MKKKTQFVDEDTIQFCDDCVAYQNIIRKEFGAPPLKTSSALCESANKRAMEIIKNGHLRVDDNFLNISENICFIDGNVLDPEVIIGHWLLESRDYDFSVKAFNINCSRFTTMIWVGCKEFGIGYCQDEAADRICVVARYSPSSNYFGLFKSNVLPRGTKMAKRKKNRVLPIAELPNHATTEDILLSLHNEYRDKHDVNNMIWKTELATKAEEYAKNILIARVNQEQDPIPDPKYGVNIFVSAGGIVPLKSVFEYWYEVKVDYDYSLNEYQPDSASFTQVIWKSSTQLGCGVAVKGEFFACVAYYYPPGNVDREYQDNVYELAKN